MDVQTENEDWYIDRDIQLDFEYQFSEASDTSKASNKEEADSSNTEENIDKLALGRTMRKATEPFPVCAHVNQRKTY